VTIRSSYHTEGDVHMNPNALHPKLRRPATMHRASNPGAGGPARTTRSVLAATLVIATITAIVGPSVASASVSEPSVNELVQRAVRVVPSWQPPASAGIRVSVHGATGTAIVGGSSASLTALNSRASVVRQRTDGFQVLSVLRRGNTADYEVSLPKGVTLRELGTAGAYVAVNRATGKTVGMIDAPWAVDAQGKRLPTSYKITGNRIRQFVNTKGANYPIVADPYFRWYWNGAVVTLTWADQMAVYQWGTSALIPMLLASGVGWTVVVPVLSAVAYSGWAAAHNQCFWFWLPYFGFGSSWGFYQCR
jgi:hypothetical protein